jgi:hypothetical protein
MFARPYVTKGVSPRESPKIGSKITIAREPRTRFVAWKSSGSPPGIRRAISNRPHPLHSTVYPGLPAHRTAIAV